MAVRLHSSRTMNHPIWLLIAVFLLKFVLTAISVCACRLAVKAPPERQNRLIATASGAFVVLLIVVAVTVKG